MNTLKTCLECIVLHVDQDLVVSRCSESRILRECSVRHVPTYGVGVRGRTLRIIQEYVKDSKGFKTIGLLQIGPTQQM